MKYNNVSGLIWLNIKLLVALVLIVSQQANSQSILLQDQLGNGELEIINRQASETQAGVYLDERNGDGFAWISGILFSEGTIELDLKGNDVRGRSFVGLAFHAIDSSTFDAIYLRPFNFRSEERRSHSIQYVAAPQFDWETLRTNFPGKYESEISPAPDPNGWIHLRIEVHGENIFAFVNYNSIPSLVVSKLNKRMTGRLGLWVGYSSGGEFSNLIVNAAK